MPPAAEPPEAEAQAAEPPEAEAQAAEPPEAEAQAAEAPAAEAPAGGAALRGHAAGRPSGLLLDIGGVVHNTSMHLVGRLAETEPAIRLVLGRIGGLGSDQDELWQQMLRRQVTERQYWAQRAAEFGAAVGETWDTQAMMHRLYGLPEQEWLYAETVELMTEVKAAGLRLGALTNDLAAFHGPGWAEQQKHLKLFDVIVDASLTGVLKPDPRAFGQAAEALGLPAEQIVFLDDMPWNVEGARRAGMAAVRVPWDGPGPAIAAARNLLRLPPRPPGDDH